MKIRWLWLLVGIIFLGGLSIISAAQSALNLSPSDYTKIGARVWKNECAGTISGLTSWNRGEDFASLGIGHFIWYPRGQHGPFEESFPELIAFLKRQGASVPGWLLRTSSCPWNTRQEFLADFESQKMRSLRNFLACSISLQSRFLAERLENALPKMLNAAPASDRQRIESNFYRVASGPSGMYALIDYVNFKGDGTLPTERYANQGWGLLQVLQGMQKGPAVSEFSKSAKRVLELRVRNSPPGRQEKRWLPGWLDRVDSYQKGISST
jgi:hypothetical protein